MFIARNLRLELTINKLKIVIVDYGAGNVRSIQNAFFLLGLTKTKLTGNVEDIETADAIVLPGVGAFSHCVSNLRKSGLVPTIEDLVFEKSVPLLGICVGMQLLAASSTENGIHAGLGWINGTVTKINPSPGFNVPHVGWNQVNKLKSDGILSNVEDKSNVFFDHSFALQCDTEYVSGVTSHGTSIVACVEKNNIYGVQFHPEKSGRNGLKILRAFANRVQNAN